VAQIASSTDDDEVQANRVREQARAYILNFEGISYKEPMTEIK